ncbi:MAG TPA: peptidylprolyl isomerase [Terriglobales bacterium]|nr:peptidylprolyl isomerase [Terriglobales bacterium]
MRFQILFYLVLSILFVRFASGQDKDGPPAVASAHENAAEAKVGPDDPVITIEGFCAAPAATGSCRTVTTRAQFERLAEALQPGMSLSLRLNVAHAYARNLRMSAAAEKRGLDKTSAFEEEMRYARMQLLAQDLNRRLQTEANDISDSDLEDYYRKNQQSFEQAVVARIFVPHAFVAHAKESAVATTQPTAAPSGVDAMAKVASDLRARAVAGEDPNKLQLDAYAEAGSPRSTVNTKMENVRRATLPPQHETVMDLTVGEVSEVFSDPEGAHFIYKMIGKRRLTLEEAKTEIRTAISGQRYHDSMKDFQGDAVFNDAYFIPPGTPGTQPQRNRREKRKRPSGQSEQDHD